MVSKARVSLRQRLTRGLANLFAANNLDFVFRYWAFPISALIGISVALSKLIDNLEVYARRLSRSAGDP